MQSISSIAYSSVTSGRAVFRGVSLAGYFRRHRYDPAVARARMRRQTLRGIFATAVFPLRLTNLYETCSPSRRNASYRPARFSKDSHMGTPKALSMGFVTTPVLVLRPFLGLGGLRFLIPAPLPLACVRITESAPYQRVAKSGSRSATYPLRWTGSRGNPCYIAAYRANSVSIGVSGRGHAVISYVVQASASVCATVSALPCGTTAAMIPIASASTTTLAVS